MKKHLINFAIAIVVFLTSLGAHGNTKPLSQDYSNITIKTILNLQGIIWGFDFLDQNHIIFTLRSGRMGVAHLQTKKITWLTGLPEIHAHGQGGLLDIKVRILPNKPPHIFFTYSKPMGKKATTALATAKLKGNLLVELKDIFIAKAYTSTNYHFGSRIAFAEKGSIYMSIGDRGVRTRAQDLKSHCGKILKLTLKGRPSPDNPFFKRKNALPEIWSVGHRNPQGLFYDPAHKKLWGIEHGPRGGDEINLIRRGQNYGWPVITYGKEYHNNAPIGVGTSKQGMLQPIKYYDPSIAPSSLIVYQGGYFKKWKGSLFSGALKLTHLNRVKLSRKHKPLIEERLLKHLKQRIRNVREGPQGRIWVSTDQGNLIKIGKK